VNLLKSISIGVGGGNTSPQNLTLFPPHRSRALLGSSSGTGSHNKNTVRPSSVNAARAVNAWGFHHTQSRKQSIFPPIVVISFDHKTQLRGMP